MGREDPALSQEGTRFWTSCSLSHSVGELCFLLRRAQSLPLEQVGACSFSQFIEMFRAQDCRGNTYTCPGQGRTGWEGRPQRVGKMELRAQALGWAERDGEGASGELDSGGRVTQACRGQCSPAPHASGSHADPVELPGF